MSNLSFLTEVRMHHQGGPLCGRGANHHYVSTFSLVPPLPPLYKLHQCTQLLRSLRLRLRSPTVAYGYILLLGMPRCALDKFSD